MSLTYQFPSTHWIKLLRERSQRSSMLHGEFLNHRQVSLQGLKALVELQMKTTQPEIGIPARRTAMRPAVFSSAQLDAFGTGKISDCLGPGFAKYDGRRIPRIPNGELKMMSRVTTITGQPGNFSQPAFLEVEYDVPENPWYFRDNTYPEIPTAVIMEIALQPCGFLSAYLDTYSLVPYGAFYFRNLDGSLKVLKKIDLRGKTILTRARMLSSVVSSGTVIQKFAFELSCEGQPVYEGESVFGYFSTQTMANQVGLDHGRKVSPWLLQMGENGGSWLDLNQLAQVPSARPAMRLSGGWLNYLDRIYVQNSGGNLGKGYIYADRMVNPDDWFYTYHFYQDPVMPGSLGVEAVFQAMQGYALANGLGNVLRAPHFGQVSGMPPLTWRYRGQITPQHKRMELEVHITAIQQRAEGVVISGDGSLWVDGLRIYEVKNAALGILEG